MALKRRQSILPLFVKNNYETPDSRSLLRGGFG